MNTHDKILTADPDQIEQFVDALFRYASDGTVVSLRAFDDLDRGAAPFAIEPVTLRGLAPLTDAATRFATRCAQATRPIVCCPPVTTFRTADNAKEANVAEGLALSVECDEQPSAARETLAAILGPPTLVAASGGEWTDPETGEVQDKLHIHWRLTEPTTTPEDHAKLKEARRLATVLVGSDATNVPLVHPIRWPGSWHRKSAPKMARIAALNEGAEIELQEALEALQEAVGASAQGDRPAGPETPATGAHIDTGEGFAGKTADDYAELLDACARDGWKHWAVVRVAASLAAQGCNQPFVEGVIRRECPVWDRNVEKAIASGFEKFRRQTAEAEVTADWPEPPAKLLAPEVPPAPALPLDDVFGPRFATWARGAADAKGAPIDYAVLSVLSVLSSVVGNCRWVAPWQGWAEPPVIWSMLIGLPSAGKSPAADAALQPLRAAERPLREAAEAERKEWAEKAEIAKLAETTWKEAVKAAIKAGEAQPERPKEADAGPPPHIPRLVTNDATIERLGVILANQPRGILQFRDELAGWLEGMARYSGGGSDRPFWLEAYGGRGYTVERMGREPLTIDRLTIAVLGGVQPDRLKTLLFKADDDGLLARFLPIWPEPAPLKRPGVWADEDMMRRVVETLLTLRLMTDENDDQRPWLVPFNDRARDLMDEFRQAVRDWEAEADGLLLSFIGKLPGLTARLSLLIAFLDWAAEGEAEPHEITVSHFGRAAHLVEAYILPMARRAYADAATPKADRAARRLIGLIREQGWSRFTSRDVLRLDRGGLGTKADLDPALDVLLDAEVIRALPTTKGPQGGRPARAFAVNPAILGGQA
jgi:hypothetical protein